jgi:hypothetical protein
MAKIKVQNTEISIIQFSENDFISLTDISSGFKEGSSLISKWITNKNTLEYLSIWEKIHNTSFNYPEFGVIEKESGVNRFTMSVGQWINSIMILLLTKINLNHFLDLQKGYETCVQQLAWQQDRKRQLKVPIMK